MRSTAQLFTGPLRFTAVGQKSSEVKMANKKHVRCSECGLKRKSAGHDEGEDHIRRKAWKASKAAQKKASTV